MKRLFLLLALTGLMSTPIWAQDDDLYFTPSKESEEAKTTDTAPTKTTEPTYYSGSNRDVDEYNRRVRFRSSVQDIDSLGNDIIAFAPVYGDYPDSMYVDTTRVFPLIQDDDSDYYWTRRLCRWDGFYDPWFYSYYGSPWRWYYGGWYDPWYGPYWYDAWYDPWFYGYGWGWYPGYAGWWGYPWYPGYWHPFPGWGGTIVGNIGGHNSGGFAGSRTYSGSNRYTSTTGKSFGGRTFGRNGNTTYTSSRFGSRTFNNRTNNSRPFNNNRPTNSYQPNTGSHNFGGSSSFGGRSFGGGGHVGGGSFGGGRVGGGSFGGRR